MVFLILCIILISVIVASWYYCRREEDFYSFKVYTTGKVALLLLILLILSTKTLNFFCYNEEVSEIKVQQIVTFNDSGRNRRLAIIEVNGEKTAFEISDEHPQTIKISKKSSKFPIFDNWTEDWKLKK